MKQIEYPVKDLRVMTAIAASAIRKGVKFEHVMEDGQAKLREVKQLLNLLNTEMQKYESLTTWDYGDVGDLGYIEERLNEAWEFATETL